MRGINTGMKLLHSKGKERKNTTTTWEVEMITNFIAINSRRNRAERI